MANRAIDWYMTYQFMKRLVLPFTSWPAYKTGVIDGQGNVIVKSSLRTPQQNDSWDIFDVLVANLKKILAKIPGGSSKIASIAAAAWLMKEHRNPTVDPNNIELIEQSFAEYCTMLTEEAPVNAVGGGNVAGVGVGPQGEPPGKAAVLKKMLKRKQPNVGTATSS